MAWVWDLSKVIQRPHPLTFAKRYWPDTTFYREQRQAIVGIKEDVETVIVSANKMGKDFGAAYIALSFFLCPQMYFPDHYVAYVESQRRGRPDLLVHTRRVVTTSIKEDHLRVLWAEIGRFLQTSDVPLIDRDGGPLVVNDKEIRFREEMHAKNPINYLIGKVSEKGEGMAGHHAAYTLAVGDEASGLDDQVYVFMQGWAKRFLFFGNPHETQNFWRKMVDGGDVEVKDQPTQEVAA